MLSDVLCMQAKMNYSASPVPVTAFLLWHLQQTALWPILKKAVLVLGS